MDSGTLASMLPFAAMILVLYFFMIRPQMSKAKKEKSFQAEIKKGAKVVTSSGIHGKIAEINTTDNHPNSNNQLSGPGYHALQNESFPSTFNSKSFKIPSHIIC